MVLVNFYLADKIKYIPNDNTTKYPFSMFQLVKRLDTQLNGATNRNSIISKVVKPTNNININNSPFFNAPPPPPPTKIID